MPKTKTLILDPNRPPAHLSAESKRLWVQLNTDFEFESATLLLLKVALEAYDGLQAARKEIAKDGLTITGPNGMVRAHPSLNAERVGRIGFLQAWRQMGIGIDPPGSIGRPPGR